MTRSRTLLGLLLALALWPLLGAAPPSAALAPTVVVYPLTSTGQTGAEAGGNVSLLLATKLAELGGVAIKPATPGTERPQFLEAARAAGADYYITGIMTPVGAEVSLIVQVVSTSSGSVVYSTTTMARTYADATNQADALRDAIVRHAGRGLPSLGASALAPSGTPVPSASDAGSVNLSKALGRKKRTAKAAPAAAATAAPATAAPASPAAAAQGAPVATATALAARAGGSPAVAGAPLAGRRLVVAVGGTGTATDRAYAASALARALARGGAQSGLLSVTAEEAAAHVAELCRANAGTRALYATTLTVETASRVASAVIDVTAYDCGGAPPVRRQVRAAAPDRRSGTHGAIDRAARAAVEALQRAPSAG